MLNHFCSEIFKSLNNKCLKSIERGRHSTYLQSACRKY